MTTFDDRESAFEAKFAHDSELQFRVLARRDKLLGLWAAAKLGHEGDAAKAYAASVVSADFQHPGDEDVIAKVAGDLAAVGIAEAEVRAELLLQGAEAMRQYVAEEAA